MRSWNFYTANEIKPAGWLKRQLKIQALGLSGNLDKVWRDVRDSAWIGGDAEGWERVPYWLDGFIPLAYLLEDSDLISRAQKYIDAIVASQQPDGWICPCSEEEIPEYDTWAVLLIAKVLTVYYECSKDEKIPPVIYKTLKNYYNLLSCGKIKLFRWGEYRWYEGFIAINFLYGRYKEDWLCDLAKILKAQGTDYCSKVDLWERPLNKWTFDTHIVNIAMMLKQEAVSCDLLGEQYTDKAEYLHNILTKYNGTVTGTYTGDECLSGISAIQGTELCAIVEQMYSCQHLFAYTGDKKWAERLEVLAFNALPATISDDMWAHQYVQMSNQINCIKFPGRPLFRTNPADSHLFGLEPSFGCCTANFNQGWPKFTLSAFMHNGDTVINTVAVPSVLTTKDFTINLSTEYPFKNRFKYTITSKKNFTFKIRIPSFAENVVVNGNVVNCNNELIFDISADSETVLNISFDAVAQFINRPYDLKSVKWGSLLFALPIKYQKVMYEYTKNNVERKFPYCDYEYVGQSDWNYAFSSEELKVEFNAVDEVPFSSENPAVVIKTEGVKINWGFEDGFDTVCAKVPQSRIPVSESKEITLYPYGCAKLRMTEMPQAEYCF